VPTQEKPNRWNCSQALRRAAPRLAVKVTSALDREHDLIVVEDTLLDARLQAQSAPLSQPAR
jgi:hypothetical protein